MTLNLLSSSSVLSPTFPSFSAPSPLGEGVASPFSVLPRTSSSFQNYDDRDKKNQNLSLKSQKLSFSRFRVSLSLSLSLSSACVCSSSSSSLSRFVVFGDFAAILEGEKGLVFRVYKSVDFFLIRRRTFLVLHTSFIGYTTESVKTHSLKILSSLSLSLDISLTMQNHREIRRWTLCSRLFLFRLASSPRRRLFWRWTRPPPPWPWPSSPPA